MAEDAKLTTVGLIMTSEFPTEAYNKVHSHLNKYKDSHKVQRGLFSLGWNGLAYRYQAMTDYDEQFTTSVKVSKSPPPEERYNQGQALFGFFINAVSVIECLFFATYCIASILKPEVFSISTKEDLKFKLGTFRANLDASFPNDPLTKKMTEFLGEKVYTDMKDIRNVLTHRGMLPRGFYAGGERNGMATMPVNPSDPSDQWQFDFQIDEQTTSSRRQWLSKRIDNLVSAIADFCNRRL